ARAGNRRRARVLGLRAPVPLLSRRERARQCKQGDADDQGAGFHGNTAREHAGGGGAVESRTSRSSGMRMSRGGSDSRSSRSTFNNASAPRRPNSLAGTATTVSGGFRTATGKQS